MLSALHESLHTLASNRIIFQSGGFVVSYQLSVGEVLKRRCTLASIKFGEAFEAGEVYAIAQDFAIEGGSVQPQQLRGFGLHAATFLQIRARHPDQLHRAELERATALHARRAVKFPTANQAIHEAVRVAEQPFAFAHRQFVNPVHFESVR